MIQRAGSGEGILGRGTRISKAEVRNKGLGEETPGGSLCTDMMV